MKKAGSDMLPANLYLKFTIAGKGLDWVFTRRLAAPYRQFAVDVCKVQFLVSLADAGFSMIKLGILSF